MSRVSPLVAVSPASTLQPLTCRPICTQAIDVRHSTATSMPTSAELNRATSVNNPLRKRASKLQSVFRSEKHSRTANGLGLAPPQHRRAVSAGATVSPDVAAPGSNSSSRSKSSLLNNLKRAGRAIRTMCEQRVDRMFPVVRLESFETDGSMWVRSVDGLPFTPDVLKAIDLSECASGSRVARQRNLISAVRVSASCVLPYLCSAFSNGTAPVYQTMYRCVSASCPARDSACMHSNGRGSATQPTASLAGGLSPVPDFCKQCNVVCHANCRTRCVGFVLARCACDHHYRDCSNHEVRIVPDVAMPSTGQARTVVTREPMQMLAAHAGAHVLLMRALQSMQQHKRALTKHRDAVEGRRRQHFRALFSKLDSNKDKFVSRQEARQYYLSSRHFHPAYIQWVDNLDNDGVCWIESACRVRLSM